MSRNPREKEKKRRRLPMPTHRDGIRALSYYDGKRVRVNLYDEFGCRIPQSETSYTLKNGESEESGQNHALLRALEKVDQMRDAMDPELNSGPKAFSDCWYGLSPGQRSQCANGLSTDDPEQIPEIKYFQRNVLERLDRYGLSITQTQILTIREELLMETLKRVTYNKILVKQEDAAEVPKLISALKDRLSARYTKSGDMIASVLAFVEHSVLEDDRLRTLLERHLRVVGILSAADTFMKSLSEDRELAGLLRKQRGDGVVSTRILDHLRLLSGNVPVAKRTVNGHLLAINRMMQGLALSQEDAFPVIFFPVYEDALAYQEEKQKALPRLLRLTFARRMLDEAATSYFAAAALIMLATGTRTEEICAMRFSQVLDRGDYGVYAVTTTNREGTIAQRGKNPYFARIILLMKFVMAALSLRRAYLRSKGYTDEEINTFYIACNPEDVRKQILPSKFSETVRGVLLDCGCSTELLNDAERAQSSFFPELDAETYLLRRDLISIQCNNSGIDPLLVDAMVGHELPYNSPDWFAVLRDEDKWESIVRQMERYVYIPELSLNPAYHPFDVEEQRARLEQPTQEIAINTKKGERYRVVFEVSRGTEYIQADLPPASEAELASSTSSTTRPGALILPLIPQEDYRCAAELANASQKSKSSKKGAVSGEPDEGIEKADRGSEQDS